MSRLKRAAAETRAAADRNRANGHEDAAKRMEARADALESGQVPDRTDSVVSVINWAFGRR